MSDEFGKLDLEEIRSENARLHQVRENPLDNYIPMPQGRGEIIVRLLPPRKGKRPFVYTRLHHMRPPGSNDNRGRRVHCPQTLTPDGKWDRSVPCPICEFRNWLFNQGRKVMNPQLQWDDPNQPEEYKRFSSQAQAIRPVERYYYNAIIRSLVTKDGTLTNVGPRILSCGKQLHQIIMEVMEPDKRTSISDVTDLVNGYDLIIKNTPKGNPGGRMYPDYGRSEFDRERSPAGTPDEIKRWASGLKDLEALRDVKDLAFIRKELARYRGIIPDEEEGFDPDKFDEEYLAEFGGTAPAHTSATSGSSATAGDSPSGGVGFEEFESGQMDEPAKETVKVDDIDADDFAREMAALRAEDEAA